MEKEKLAETGAIESDIRKIEGDLEDLRKKMKSKENNPNLERVNAFFRETREFI